MRQSHLILSNALIAWICHALSLFPHWVFAPYLLTTIGDTGYGAYALIWSLLTAVEQFQRSLQSGIIKYSAASFAQENIQEVNKILSSTFLYSILLAIVGSSLFLFTFYLYGDQSLHLGRSPIVVGATIFLIVPLTPYVGIIQAKQAFYVDSIVTVLSKYVTLLAVVIWFSWKGPSIEALVVVMSIILMISRAIHVPIAYRFARGLRNSYRCVDKRYVKLIASFGFGTVLAALCLVANSTGIRWMMNALVSTEFVAHLTILTMPAIMLQQIITPVTITVMPATSAYAAACQTFILKELLVKSMRYIVILASAASISAALLMETVLSAWVGPAYTFLAPYAICTFLGTSLMVSTSAIHHMLKGLGRIKTVVMIYAVGLVLVPFLSIPVIVRLSDNAYAGVTIGLVAGQVVCALLHMIIGARVVSVSLSEVFRRVFAHSPIAAFAIYLMATNILRVADERSGLVLVTATAGITAAYMAYCFAFVATPCERKQILDIKERLKEKLNGISRAISPWLKSRI